MLVETQLAENIGMAARAMLNCGFSKLRLVSPRMAWPNQAAEATAADADEVLENAEIFSDLDEAIADCEAVVAVTARERSLGTPFGDPDEVYRLIRERVSKSGRVALLFGPEASGLTNEAIARAEMVLTLSTNPQFPSLNLAQAVLLCCWEWAREDDSEKPMSASSSERARQREVDSLLSRLVEQLELRQFFLTESQKPSAMRQLRSALSRSQLTRTEVNLWHGVLTALLRREGAFGDSKEGD